ncbi:MAG: hypothetical protein ACOC9J_04900 [Persicimonas sp.]
MFEESDKKGESNDGSNEPRAADPAQTAEFDYIDDWDDESEASSASNSGSERKGAPAAGVNSKAVNGKDVLPGGGQDQGSITRALEDFDAYLGENDGDLAGAGGQSPELSRSKANLSNSSFDRSEPSGAFGFDKPQVSGVFSRYDEETRESDSDEFDLFEEEDGDDPHDRTLQDIVNSHEKQIRRLKKQLAYQKEVIQVVSELLVEARVISKRELKKRLRALRQK